MTKAGSSIGLILLLSLSLVVGAFAVQASGLVSASSQPTGHSRDFSLEVHPSFLVLTTNANKFANVTVGSIGQFSGMITLSASIAPLTNSPPSLSFAPSTVRLKAGQTANSSLTVSTSLQTTFANYTITVLAQGSKISHSVSINVFIVTPLVPDFSFTLLPSAETVAQSTNRDSFYNIASINGFSGPISITPSAPPGGVGVGVQPPPALTPGANFTGGLSIHVDISSVPGTYSIIFTAQSGSIIHNATLLLTISSSPPPDFTLATNPTFLTVPQGSTALVFVIVSSIGGFNGTISLTSGVVPVISGGPTAVLNQSSVFLFSGFTRGVELRIITTATSSTGSYNYTVTGISGSLTHTAVGSFTVSVSLPPDFSISASPTTLSIPQGSSNRVFLNVTSLNGFSGTVNLNATASPAGPRLVLGATSATLASGGTTEVVLAIFVNATVPPPTGNYVITVIGVSGSLSHSVNIQLTITTAFASLVLVSHVFQPTNVTLQLQNQGNAPITLSYYQVLDGSNNNWTRAGWPGPTLAPGSTALAMLTIGASCPSCTYRGVPGAFNQFSSGNTYHITVVGNGQGFTFTLLFASTTEGLSLDSTFFFSGTNVTLFLRNIGNVSVSLVSYSVRDASGDQYALTAWSGPTIPAGSLFPAEILIGSSCPSCTLTGNAFTFTPGQTYTIVLVTSRNNQFSFSVTR